MEKERESFMSKAGNIEAELNEIRFEDSNNVMSPATTETTVFFTIFCC